MVSGRAGMTRVLNLGSLSPTQRVRKGSRAGWKDGLPGDFRHLAVGWQPSRAAMRMFCLPVKSSELYDIAEFPAALARAGGRKWQKYEGHPSEISLSGPRTRIGDGSGARRAPGAKSLRW